MKFIILLSDNLNNQNINAIVQDIKKTANLNSNSIKVIIVYKDKKENSGKV